MHETRLSKPANNQTLDITSAHQSAVRQSSLPLHLLPKDETRGRVNFAHEHSSDEESIEEEEDDINDEEKAMIQAQQAARRKSSGASRKVSPSSQVSSAQVWQQVGYLLLLLRIYCITPKIFYTIATSSAVHIQHFCSNINFTPIQATEPLWPVDMDASTGPGHAGAGTIALPGQEATNRPQQGFGSLMVSVNTFLQQKLVSLDDKLNFSAYREQ